MAQPVTTKATVTTHTTEQSVTLPAGYSQARVKNRNKYAINYAWRSGQSLTAGYVVPPNTVLTIDVPTKFAAGVTQAIMYYQTVHVGDVLEAECF